MGKVWLTLEVLEQPSSTKCIVSRRPFVEANLFDGGLIGYLRPVSVMASGFNELAASSLRMLSMIYDLVNQRSGGFGCGSGMAR